MLNLKNFFAIFILISLFEAPVFPQDVFQECGMEGDTESEYLRTMNRLKNRYIIPVANDIDSAVSFRSLLSPGLDIGRFRESKAVEITAWVRDVKWGSIETCNCFHTGQNLQDVHIELVRTKNTTSQKKVVVAEITPRLRKIIFDSLGINMSNTKLKNTLKGYKVKIKGWLFFDWEHISDAVNTDSDDDSYRDNNRATVWEIHPVTSIEIIQ